MEKAKSGLSQAEAKKRLEKFGLNQVVKPWKVSFLGIAKEEIVEPMILLLLVVGVIYSLSGSLDDALTIFAIIFILVFVEVWNEFRAKKTISSLSKIASPTTKVIRAGKVVEVETENIVPGDLLVLTPGTRIASDSRVLLSFSLQVDESSLTGESFSQEKKIGDEIYAGTLVVSGEGKAESYATGRDTKIGKISTLAQAVKPPKTPLQLAMKSLAKTLVWFAIIFSVIPPLVGYLRGLILDPRQALLTALALAFAVIPEEIPIIITMILGLGAYRLSQKKFLVKKLRAAEVMGDVTVILTDKTGTITENKMRVVSVFPKDQERKIIQSALASLTEISISPTDKAIIERAGELRIRAASSQVLRERSFGDSRKTKTIIRDIEGNIELFLIGAPEETLSLAKGDKGRIEQELRTEAEKGRRVVAVAQKTISPNERNLPFSDLEYGLNLTGLISLEDPPRKGVKETVDIAKQAGIRTMVVTGDHPLTAASIAKTVGIPSEKVLTGDDLNKMSDSQLRKAVREVSVFARTTPEHKYRLVRALHKNKEVVAVTGDGVNDAIALKGADIGIAMGVKGTDAAREAADAVLADDNFNTIGEGIFEGRKFHDNLRKGVKYYLSVKVALILVFLFPVILNIEFPFAPIQIILLELFMDLAASAGFISEPAEKTIYKRPPRDPKEKFIDSKMLKGIAVSGASLFIAVTIAYLYARWLGLSLIQAQTFAFSAWIIGHIILAIVSRSEKEPLYKLGFFSNRAMVVWAVAALSFLIILVGVPGVGGYFKLETLTVYQFGLIFAISFLIIFLQEIKKLISFKAQ
ncbi:MAG: cation-transporting P-type ATPase [Candidatus Atabeyarchaeum deiterrae]